MEIARITGSGMLIPGSNVRVTLPRLQSHSFENYYCMIMTNDKNRSRRMKSITCTKLQNSCTCRFRVENEKSVLCSKKKMICRGTAPNYNSLVLVSEQIFPLINRNYKKKP